MLDQTVLCPDWLLSSWAAGHGEALPLSATVCTRLCQHSRTQTHTLIGMLKELLDHALCPIKQEFLAPGQMENALGDLPGCATADGSRLGWKVEKLEYQVEMCHSNCALLLTDVKAVSLCCYISLQLNPCRTRLFIPFCSCSYSPKPLSTVCVRSV